MNENSSTLILATNRTWVEIIQVDVTGSPIPISDNTKLVGVTIDSSLAFNKHASLEKLVLQVPHLGSSPHSPNQCDAGTSN